MSDYLVTGKKGNGKSLVCVGRIQEALLRGVPVATNLDLYLEHLLPPHLRNTRVFRLPDRPTRADLDAIGVGNPEVDESRNGVLVLDELATWCNSRNFGDKDRQGVLDWLVHSRKLGWDTYLIAQHPNQIDKQIRESLCEYHVICRRLDKLKLPILPIKLPRVHIGLVRYGMERDSILAERWIYRGNSLFNAYDTRQVFKATYDKGLYCLLPPWHLVGHKHVTWKQRLKIMVKSWINGPERPKIKPKPKLPEVALIMGFSPDARIGRLRDMGVI